MAPSLKLLSTYVLLSQVTSRLLEADRRKLCVLQHELQVHACRATHRTVRTMHVNPALWTTLFQGPQYRATVLFSSQSNSVLIMSLSMQSYHLKRGLPLLLLCIRYSFFRRAPSTLSDSSLIFLSYISVYSAPPSDHPTSPSFYM